MRSLKESYRIEPMGSLMEFVRSCARGRFRCSVRGVGGMVSLRFLETCQTRVALVCVHVSRRQQAAETSLNFQTGHSHVSSASSNKKSGKCRGYGVPVFFVKTCQTKMAWVS